MKNAIKISLIFSFTALYCLAVFFAYGVFSGTALHIPDQQKTNAEVYYTKTLNRQISALPAKYSGFTEISCPESSSKRQFELSNDFIKSTEQVIFQSFKKYILHSNSFSVHLQTANLLFPFHYFL